jgi:hypothetical protein
MRGLLDGFAERFDLRCENTFPPGFAKQSREKTGPFLTRGAIDFLFAFAILWLFRNRGEIAPRAIIDRSLSPEVLAEMQALPFYQRCSCWSTILVACVVALYIRFFRAGPCRAIHPGMPRN